MIFITAPKHYASSTILAEYSSKIHKPLSLSKYSWYFLTKLYQWGGEGAEISGLRSPKCHSAFASHFYFQKKLMECLLNVKGFSYSPWDRSQWSVKSQETKWQKMETKEGKNEVRRTKCSLCSAMNARQFWATLPGLEVNWIPEPSQWSTPQGWMIVKSEGK